MKKTLLLLGSLTAFLAADLSVEQIQNMVTKIHKKREGVKLETLESTKEPFVRVEEENNTTVFVIPTKVETKEAKLVLHSIINDKAFINDEWKRVGDTVLGYTLKHIGQRGVVLRNNNHIKKLFLRKEREKFITIEER
jgi:hypothetical protein